MNGAQAHLLLNHLPVIIPIVAFGILGCGFYARSEMLLKVALWIMLVGSLSAIPAFLTGEPAEAVIKNYPGASRRLIHDHERLAKKALVLIEVLGAAAIVLLIALHRRQKVRPWMWALYVVASLASLIVFMQTAHLGGLIVHEEIRTDEFASPPP